MVDILQHIQHYNTNNMTDYTNIFVPCSGAPFRTGETVSKIVGGAVECFEQINGQDLVVHPLFLDPKGCNNNGNDKRWAVVEKLLRRKSYKKSIYCNENGLMECCPNMAMIITRQEGNRPLHGDICIRLTTNTYNKHFYGRLPYYKTFEDYQEVMCELAELDEQAQEAGFDSHRDLVLREYGEDSEQAKKYCFYK